MKSVVKLLAFILTLCLMLMTANLVLAEGNDFVFGELRVDLSEVYNARDYKVLLLTDNQPDAMGGFTAAWLGLDLAQYNGQPYSTQFSQVGLLTDKDGVYGFIYAEPGVTCLRGSPEWGSCNGRPCGCTGNTGDLVALGSWHWVELACSTWSGSPGGCLDTPIVSPVHLIGQANTTWRMTSQPAL